MPETIYIKIPQCVEIHETTVLLKDIATIYTKNEDLKQQIQTLPIHTFQPNKKTQLVVSILRIIELISLAYPDVDIQNLGEEDFILLYSPPGRHEKIKEYVFTFFICLIAFFGGGYAIMAYNTDTGAKELFTYLSMLFLGNATKGITILVITYSIGLTTGMILFFNHLGNKKLSSDPTPLEIQMRLYENDLSTTIIKDQNRRGKNLDINNSKQSDQIPPAKLL